MQLPCPDGQVAMWWPDKYSSPSRIELLPRETTSRCWLSLACVGEFLDSLEISLAHASLSGIAGGNLARRSHVKVRTPVGVMNDGAVVRKL